MNKARRIVDDPRKSFAFTIEGQPASKSNTRQLVMIQGKPRMIKSKRALAYEKVFKQQCPVLDPLMEGDLFVEMTMYYGSRRPDMDETLILDLMQDRIYANDRQVKGRLTMWALDKDNPRIEVSVHSMDVGKVPVDVVQALILKRNL